ncbi:MAG: sugar ABC transporter substrate-binding protein, partial [Spirochaetales bacterium]
MTRRKVVAMLVLATVFSGSLFAEGQAEDGEVTLTVAGRDGAFGDALDIATEAYTEENPNVSFEVLKLSGSELLEQS